MLQRSLSMNKNSFCAIELHVCFYFPVIFMFVGTSLKHRMVGAEFTAGM